MALILFVAFAATATAQQLPDPTERTAMSGPRSTGGASSPWVLQSTLVSEHRRVAVINGEAVEPGDTVAGAQVLEIDAYTVRLRTAAGATVVLTLTDDDPKRVAGGGTE